MSADDYLLVGIATAIFSIFGLLGWLRPRLWLWRWVDVIYYPLAAIGIVLLFFTNDINRSLLKIEANQAAAEQAWRERPNPRPDVEFEAGSAGLLRARYGWFDAVRRLGDVCAKSTTEGCSAYRKHAEAMLATFGDFSVPQEGDTVALARAEEAFCRAGFNYVERLAEDSFFAFGAYDRLKEALGQLNKGKDKARLMAWLDRKMTEDQHLFATLTNKKERAIAAPYTKVEVEHSLALFGQLDWCATRDNRTSQNLKTLDVWQAEEGNRARSRAQYVRDLESVRRNKPLTPLQQASRALQQQWWPYILVLALSLKFGKAVSGIWDDINDFVRLGASACRSITSCMRQLLKRKDANTVKVSQPDRPPSPPPVAENEH